MWLLQEFQRTCDLVHFLGIVGAKAKSRQSSRWDFRETSVLYEDIHDVEVLCLIGEFFKVFE